MNMSNRNGIKLNIRVEREPLPEMVQVYVHFNDRCFEVCGYKHQHVLESVVGAAFRSCLDVVPKEEEPKLPF
jgi:hypothetical protein